MDDLRYPIGKFQHVGEVSPEQVRQWIAEIAAVPSQMRKAVEGLSEEQLDTPYRPGGWTIRQLVHHVADSHLNSYIRLKWTLTEENPVIKPYDEVRWAELSDSRLPAEVSLTLLDALHQRWVHLLNQLTPEELEKSFVHPESGQTQLSKYIGLYAWHGRHHIAHITSLRERMGW